MKFKLIMISLIVLMLGLFVTDMLLAINHHNQKQKINNLIAKEKYLKILITQNKYSRYLIIKKHYEESLMKYASTHRGNYRFVMALAQKEQAEIKYYEKK